MTTAGDHRQLFDAWECCRNISPNEAVAKPQRPHGRSERPGHVQSKYACGGGDGDAQLTRELIGFHGDGQVLGRVCRDGLNGGGFNQCCAGTHPRAWIFQPVDVAQCRTLATGCRGSGGVLIGAWLAGNKEEACHNGTEDRYDLAMRHHNSQA